ncbi:hypothetical protein B0A54_17918 [Friedmanniomyces endolithicus]|uniref:Uncharacterized protein n=1 Tax=Friedmanniomyces endolithicus TaxID=329885 RepID=A0A4U0TQI2_9PEZI|nr:hypothetical protein B0A54_17918 [Friedmanniomyces endolithicus]
MGVTYIFCIGDLDSVMNTAYGQPFIQVFFNATQSNAGTTVMVVIIIVMLTSAAVGEVATASRQLWSFARDETRVLVAELLQSLPEPLFDPATDAITLPAVDTDALAELTIYSGFGCFYCSFVTKGQDQVSQHFNVEQPPTRRGRGGVYCSAADTRRTPIGSWATRVSAYRAKHLATTVIKKADLGRISLQRDKAALIGGMSAKVLCPIFVAPLALGGTVTVARRVDKGDAPLAIHGRSHNSRRKGPELGAGLDGAIREDRLREV